MKKMTNESNLQVTFSKRRSGLFKKASELCTLCGADIALIVFSPGEKVFSFGHPNVDAVIDRYFTRAPPYQNSGAMQYLEAQRNATVRELNTQLNQMNNQLDYERNRNEELIGLVKVTQSQFWWANPIEDMTTTQLQEYKVALEELKKHLAHHAEKFLIQANNTNPIPIPIPIPPHQHQLFAGGASSSSALQPPPPPPPQMFPPQPQMLQPSMLQSHVFDGSMMRHHAFNLALGGYGHVGFF